MSAIAKVAPLKPEIRLAQAISQFEADLSDDQKATFRNLRARSSKAPPDISDVMHLTAEIERRHGAHSGTGKCFGPRLTNILQSIQQYAALGDVIVGGSQNIIACGVWSLARFTLLVRLFLSQSPICAYTDPSPSPSQICLLSLRSYRRC